MVCVMQEWCLYLAGGEPWLEFKILAYCGGVARIGVSQRVLVVASVSSVSGLCAETPSVFPIATASMPVT